MYSGNTLVQRAIELLRTQLPTGWTIVADREPRSRRSRDRPDAMLRVSAPDGSVGRIILEAKPRVRAVEAAALASRLHEGARSRGASAVLLVAGYLSPRARELLAAEGVSYLDMTGNASIVVDRPAIFITSQGAERDPAPQERQVRSLKGGSAARVVRALCDWIPPVGVRELARRAMVNPGYVTRVLALLEGEAVITRNESGGVGSVDWRALIRRWTQDYAVTRSNRALAVLEPRGVERLVERLRVYKPLWALTGSRAVPRAAATATARLLSCYVEEPEQAAADLGLTRVDVGANVLLLEPFDGVIWERTRSEAELTCVAVSQCAADLLTGTGREPSEGEALLTWMQSNESAWRS